ncbi:MAG: zf-HC2 domain-containing protein, partial [Acidobacteriota bacterium]|nr:zf-HC2 domain-containing protein [Acidobacteriota bacterium]
MTNPFRGHDDRLDAVLRAVLSEQSARALHEHPSPDLLIGYCLGALPPEDDDRLQDHLTLCPECARLVLDLTALAAPSPPAPHPSEPGLTREWERLSARLAGEEIPALRAVRP